MRVIFLVVLIFLGTIKYHCTTSLYSDDLTLVEENSNESEYLVKVKSISTNMHHDHSYQAGRNEQNIYYKQNVMMDHRLHDAQCLLFFLMLF